jgi:hypothetical protein
MADGPEPLPSPCPRCGLSFKPGAKFCTSCGAAYGGSTAQILPNYSIMRDLGDVERPIKRLIFFYVLWLATGVISFWIHREGVWIAASLAIQLVDSGFTIVWLMTAARPLLALYRNILCGWTWYLLAVAGAWPIAVLVSAFVYFINRTFSQEDTPLSAPYLDAGFGWPIIILSICAQPAVIEEMAFRGIIQSSLASMMKARDAILVSAVAFSIMHFSLIMFVPFVLLGCYLGWLRLKSGSLYPCMAAHFLHNLIVTLDEWTPLLPL